MKTASMKRIWKYARVPPPPFPPVLPLQYYSLGPVSLHWNSREPQHICASPHGGRKQGKTTRRPVPICRQHKCTAASKFVGWTLVEKQRERAPGLASVCVRVFASMCARTCAVPIFVIRCFAICRLQVQKGDLEWLVLDVVHGPAEHEHIITIKDLQHASPEPTPEDPASVRSLSACCVSLSWCTGSGP